MSTQSHSCLISVITMQGREKRRKKYLPFYLYIPHLLIESGRQAFAWTMITKRIGTIDEKIKRKKEKKKKKNSEFEMIKTR